MGFWSLLEVASMPVIQVLIISLIGAFLATDRCKLFPVESRNSMNKVVYVLFAPALMFANLAQTVTLQDIISWWFMPVNMGLTFLIGGILGWIVVKIVKPPPYLEGLIVATCSSGNMGNLPIVLVPAICDEDKSPFGNRSVCRTIGLSYASFSMALGGFYIWTYTFRLIKGSAMKLKAMEDSESLVITSSNSDLEADHKTQLLGVLWFKSTRFTFFGSQTCGCTWNSMRSVHISPNYRHRHCQNSCEFRISSTGSFVSVCFNASVHPPACHEYRYHDTAVQCRARRVLSAHALDILGRDTGPYCLVHNLPSLVSLENLQFCASTTRFYLYNYSDNEENRFRSPLFKGSYHSFDHN